MSRFTLATIAIGLVSLQAITLSQSRQPPTTTTYIAKADIESVLKHVGAEGAGTDRQIRVLDMGKYNVGVGVLHRGKTTPGAPVSGIAHSQVTEVYYVISGSGMFISGGRVVDRKEQAADAEVVRLAVGPSYTGGFQGGETRLLSAGDVVIIPPNVLHGFTEINDQVTYLSMRPDADHILPAGYVHPSLRK